MIDESMWQELEARQQTPGRSTRRLHPDSPHDIQVSVAHPTLRRMLVLGTDARTADAVRQEIHELQATRGLQLNLSSVSGNRYELQVMLTDDELTEVFTPLVSDIAEVVSNAPTTETAAEAAVHRYIRWQQLLRSVSRDGLSRQARCGLFGELHFLLEYVLAAVDQHTAISSWTGPRQANQDFQLPGAAVEVKATTARAPRTVQIASERQLDTADSTPLALAHIVLDDRQRGLGMSLNALVDEIRARLSSPSTSQRFESLLVQAGYLSNQRDLYDHDRYTLRRCDFWTVGEGFPRIVEAELPPGVGNCTYTVDVSALATHSVTAEALVDLIRGTHG
ncbi:PD-(D/E)XK motif protein [Kitasatospora sp. NPDC088391]|uniref:PD-(D/E)XK motif protein n=1 Tax=Kitasatospora sp. NPDC088391 TaxID=3364074 RepID=UPI003828E043